MIIDMAGEGRDIADPEHPDRKQDYDDHWLKYYDGVIVICGTKPEVKATRDTILKTTLGNSISHVATIEGDVLSEPGWRGYEQ